MRARQVAALLIPSSIALAAHLVAAAENPRITQLHWLVGEWETVRAAKPAGTQSVKVNERWTAEGDWMWSWGHTAKDDSLVDYESVVIKESGPYLLYDAQPMGQERAVFHSTKISESSVVFENPGHDFPQRVGYQLVRQDSLVAWIEGPGKDGKTKRIEFPYRRVK